MQLGSQRTVAAITQQQLIESEPVHFKGMLPSPVGGGELLPHYLDTCNRVGSPPLLEDQRNTEHHPASLSLPPQKRQVHLHPEAVSTGSGNSSMAPGLQASNQAPKHNQRRMDNLPGGFPFDDTHSLATLAAEVKLEVQDMAGGARSQLQEHTITGFSGFPTTFTLPQTDALGRTTSAKFRHSRQNSLCSEDEASAARGSQAGSDRDSPSQGKLERKSSTKSRGSPKDPSKISELKQLRSVRKREASKRRYMDQKQKLDELKAKSEELQVVNMHLKKDLASVYREIERLQQGQTQEMFTNLSQ